MLIEVMVAILIFAFGILGTVGLLARATQYSTNAEDRNRAALLANEMVSAMWTRGTTDVVGSPALAADYAAWRGRVSLVTANAGEVTNTSATGLPNGDGVVTRNGNVATITVTWRPPNASVNAATRAAVNNQYVTQVVVP